MSAMRKRGGPKPSVRFFCLPLHASSEKSMRPEDLRAFAGRSFGFSGSELRVFPKLFPAGLPGSCGSLTPEPSGTASRPTGCKGSARANEKRLSVLDSLRGDVLRIPERWIILHPRWCSSCGYLRSRRTECPAASCRVSGSRDRRSCRRRKQRSCRSSGRIRCRWGR